MFPHPSDQMSQGHRSPGSLFNGKYVPNSKVAQSLTDWGSEWQRSPIELSTDSVWTAKTQYYGHCELLLKYQWLEDIFG